MPKYLLALISIILALCVPAYASFGGASHNSSFGHSFRAGPTSSTNRAPVTHVSVTRHVYVHHTYTVHHTYGYSGRHYYSTPVYVQPAPVVVVRYSGYYGGRYYDIGNSLSQDIVIIFVILAILAGIIWFYRSIYGNATEFTDEDSGD
jgi:hypothetical protein